MEWISVINEDSYFDVRDNDEILWNSPKDAGKGDIIFIYTASPYKEIGFIIRVKSDKFQDGYIQKQRNSDAIIINDKISLKNPISIKELKDNPILKHTSAVKINFMGSHFKMTNKEFEELNRVIIQNNPELEDKINEFLDINNLYDLSDPNIDFRDIGMGRAHIVRDICYLINNNPQSTEEELFDLLRENLKSDKYWKAYFQRTDGKNGPKINLNSARSLNLVDKNSLKLTNLGQELVNNLDNNELFTYNYSLRIKQFYFDLALKDNIIKKAMEILKKEHKLRFWAPICDLTSRRIDNYHKNGSNYFCDEEKYEECKTCDRILLDHFKEKSLPFETYKETGIKNGGFVFWMCSRVTPMHLTGSKPGYYGKYIYWDKKAENELMELSESKEFVNIWKISPGSYEQKSYLWPLLKKKGYIGIGTFGNENFLQENYKKFDSKEEIKRLLLKYTDKSEKTTAYKMIWDFTNSIKIGDYVVTNGGRNSVLGIGIIKSDYISPNDPLNPNLDKEYSHLRQVEWLITDEIEINQEFFFGRETLNKLDGSKWNEIIIAYTKKYNYETVLFNKLYKEFKRDYLNTDNGKTHYEFYKKESEDIKHYLNKIKEDPRIVNNIEDPIINYIVPIKRRSVSTVGFNSFKVFKYKENDFPALTRNFIDLLNDLNNKPNRENQIIRIKKFKSGKYSKGIQSGVLSPLLHALNPDFNIINKKTIKTVDFISKILGLKIKINGDLLNYIENNEILNDFLHHVASEIPDLSDFHKFDAFCHWLCVNELGGYAVGFPLPLINFDEDEKAIKSNETKIEGNSMNFFEYLSEKGFYYKTELVENFLLSLKVKPFVILTGNSGTGKTKIAQLFASYLSKKEGKNTVSIINNKIVGKSYKSSGWALDRSIFYDFYPELKKYEKKYEIKIDNVESTGNLLLSPRLFYDRSDNKVKSMLNEIAEKDPKTKIKLELKIPSFDDSKYKIVPVGANWTENRHLVGFYNVITEKYQGTEALELIIKAQEYPFEPFFLILDEMNLSHVERYFSDFLSCMESGESIEIHSNDKITNIPYEIEFTENLSVIGTVNIDETTYMFSPKVLDRSNTIEFLTNSPIDYMNGKKTIEPNKDIEYLENVLSDKDIRKSDINELRDLLGNIYTSDENLWELMSNKLEVFQNILRKAGFDFGFRVINEIMRFMYVSWVYENKPTEWNNWERYFDAQIKQKILPRIHGSQRNLEDVLIELQLQCEKYPSSQYKLDEMIDVLSKQRYVTFTN